MDKTDRRVLHVFRRVPSEWTDSDEISKLCYPNKRRDPAGDKQVFIILLNLKDRGVVEQKKGVVLGEDGGELRFYFRRVPGTAPA